MSEYPPPAPVPPQYPQQPQQYQPAPKDPNNAFLIELVGGIFGLMGLGYFYTGQMEAGAIRLIAWIAFMAIGWTVTALLSAILIGLCLIPVMLVAQFGVPYWSAKQLKDGMLMLPPPAPMM
jgi:TM2 domain-containing membrane protein YozV